MSNLGSNPFIRQNERIFIKIHETTVFSIGIKKVLNYSAKIADIDIKVREVMMKVTALIIVWFTLLICGCTKGGPFSPGAYTTGKITGKVTNSVNGEAIKGASISTSPGSWVVTTDDSGEYTILNVDEGNYTVTAEKSGYRRHSVNIEVRIWQESIANIQLTPLPPQVVTPQERVPERPCP